MSTERISIHEFLNPSAGKLIIDVRSPSEYHHAHIPDAVSLPLFTDEERKIVGTAYKQRSREEAIKIGLDFFGPKMKRIVEEVEDMYDAHCRVYDLQHNADISHRTSKTVHIYCWRGGMRSGAVGWLLALYGFKIKVLGGGYKSFRHWVLEQLAYPYPFKIIGGFTGSGKTEVLKELEKRGEFIIDLEKLARHKGSAFGNIGMPPQPSQEMFENELAQELSYKSAGNSQGAADNITTTHELQTTNPIWLEDESQRIGLINIPASFWQTMRKAPVYFLDIPFEERLQHIEEEYGGYGRQQLIEAIQRIAKRLGPGETKTAVTLLKEGDIKKSFSILLTYYDRQYLKGLHNRPDLTSLLTPIRCNSIAAAHTAALLTQPALT